MKKSLLLMGLAVLVSAQASAQQISAQASKIEAMKAFGREATVANVAAVDRVEKQAVVSRRAKAPRRSIANEVWYQRPYGTFYGGSGTSNGGYCYPFIPAFTEVKWENMAANKADAVWTMTYQGESDVLDGDENNDLVVSYPKVSTGYISSYYIPELTANNITFKTGGAAGQVAMINGDSLLWSVSQVNQAGGTYTGFSNGAVFGTTSRPFVVAEGDTVDFPANAIYEFYEKPVTPLYVSSLYLYMISANDYIIPEETDLVAVIYKMEDNQLTEILAEMPFNTNDTVWTDPIEDNEYFKSRGLFEVKNIKTNQFGTKYQVPVIIDSEFCISIRGFNQDGVDCSLFMTDVLETETDSYEKTGKVTPTCRSYVNPRTGEQRDGFYYCQYIDSETSKRYNEEEGDNYDWTRQYNALILLNSMMDVVRIGSDFLEMTAPEEGGAAYVDIEVTDEEEDEDEEPETYIERFNNLEFQTTLPWLSDWEGLEGDENYFFEELPDWIEEPEVNSRYYTSSQGYVQLAKLIAEPLPDDVEGRYADIHIVSDRGADAVVRVIQGKVESAIVTMKYEPLTKPTNKTFNMAGQQVADGFRGLVVKNGKKFYNK